jgi:hypothetical protein
VVNLYFRSSWNFDSRTGRGKSKFGLYDSGDSHLASWNAELRSHDRGEEGSGEEDEEENEEEEEEEGNDDERNGNDEEEEEKEENDDDEENDEDDSE